MFQSVLIILIFLFAMETPLLYFSIKKWYVGCFLLQMTKDIRNLRKLNFQNLNQLSPEKTHLLHINTLFYVYECCTSLACMCLCTMCVPGACITQKRALDTLGLELQMFVTHPVGAGN